MKATQPTIIPIKSPSFNTVKALHKLFGYVNVFENAFDDVNVSDSVNVNVGWRHQLLFPKVHISHHILHLYNLLML